MWRSTDDGASCEDGLDGCDGRMTVDRVCSGNGGHGPGHRRRHGFTLLELLVVMVIIGLLAAYVAPRYFSQVGKSEVRAAQAQVAALRNALDTYRLDVGQYPTNEQGTAALTARPQGLAKWNGPYMQRAVPPDPWGRPYQYKSPGEHGDFDLYSFGKDGQVGGSGEDADVTSW